MSPKNHLHDILILHFQPRFTLLDHQHSESMTDSMGSTAEIQKSLASLREFSQPSDASTPFLSSPDLPSSVSSQSSTSSEEVYKFPLGWRVAPPPDQVSPELSLIIEQIKTLVDGSTSGPPYWSEFLLKPQDAEVVLALLKFGALENTRLRYGRCLAGL